MPMSYEIEKHTTLSHTLRAINENFDYVDFTPTDFDTSFIDEVKKENEQAAGDLEHLRDVLAHGGIVRAQHLLDEFHANRENSKINELIDYAHDHKDWAYQDVATQRLLWLLRVEKAREEAITVDDDEVGAEDSTVSSTEIAVPFPEIFKDLFLFNHEW